LITDFARNARFGSNSAVAAAPTLPPLWVRKRYGQTGTRRQILSTRLVEFGSQVEKTAVRHAVAINFPGVKQSK